VQQSQPELLPQYGHTHWQSSMKLPHLSQRGSSLSSLAIHFASATNLRAAASELSFRKNSDPRIPEKHTPTNALSVFK